MAGSPKPDTTETARRRAIATKVDVPKANIKQTRPLNANQNIQATTGPLPKPDPDRPPPSRGKAQRGILEADLQSYPDTTDPSNVQVEDSQIDQHGRPYAQHPQFQLGQPGQFHEGEDEGSQIDEGYSYFDNEITAQAMEQTVDYYRSLPPQYRQQEQASVFEGDCGSYPTTSAPQEEQGNHEDHEGQYQEQQLPATMANYPAMPQHQRRNLGAATRSQQAPQQISAPNQHLAVSLSQPLTMNENKDIHDKVDHLKRLSIQDQRAAIPPTQNMPQTQQFQPGPARAGRRALGGAQQPSFAPINERPNTSAAPKPRASLPTQPPGTQFSNVPQQQQPAVQTESMDLDGRVHADYTNSQLDEMDYDVLLNESFDFDPSAPKESVLPSNVQNKPLNEQLEYAHKHLRDDEKRTFFNSMTTSNWEDAGDWFADQFAAIEKKLRDLRREKRRASERKEQMVHVRHVKVMKRKALIDDAIDNMRAYMGNMAGPALLKKQRTATPKPPKPPKERDT
jgi:Extracellular mutant protein 11